MIILVLESLDTLEDILKARPDGIVIGLESLSARTHALTTPEKLPALVDFFHSHQIQVFLNAQAMIEQSRLEEIRKDFFAALQAGADGIYIADDGYIALADEAARHLALEQKTEIYRHKLIMQPETLLCSGEDAAFYLMQGLQGASLSHELTEEEILQSARIAAPYGHVEVLAAGRFTWMESRRPLIENYLRYIGRPDLFEEGHIYTIRELMRPAKLPIWQDARGTHILSDAPRQAGAAIQAMALAGVDRFRIDAFGQSNAWGASMVQAYRTLLEGLNKAGSTGKEAEEAEEKYARALAITGKSNLPQMEQQLIKEKNHAH